MTVVYGHSSSHICGRSDHCACLTGSDVSHVTGRDHVRKYVLRMHNLFHRKWQSHVTGRGHVRPYLFPVFSPVLFSRIFFFLVLPPPIFFRIFFYIFFPRTIFPYFFWNVGIYIIWIFLIMFYLEHKDTPILEDYINDTLKDDRNRSWRVILFALKPKRGLKCFIVPTNHITGNWTNQITRNEPTRSLIPKTNNQLQPS